MTRALAAESKPESQHCQKIDCMVSYVSYRTYELTKPKDQPPTTYTTINHTKFTKRIAAAFEKRKKRGKEKSHNE